ncbi:MAG: hypothetical protein ACT4QC_20410 [Planctomycetaceae bacterium]
MKNFLASFLMGAALLTLGSVLLRWHLRAWSTERRDATLDDRERSHYRARFLRRVQVAALLILLGILIPAGDLLMAAAQRRHAGLITGYWIVVLLMTLWVMLLAALDWVSSRANLRAHRAALAAVNRKRQELEAEVARLRRQHGNGRG